MGRARRGGAALLVAVATAASMTAASVPAGATTSTYATRYAKALAAVQLLKHDGYKTLGLPARDAVRVKACYRDVCAKDRLQAEPVCDPGSVCLGTALRAVKVTRRLTVIAHYA
jgi:hypothetical protein